MVNVPLIRITADALAVKKQIIGSRARLAPSTFRTVHHSRMCRTTQTTSNKKLEANSQTKVVRCNESTHYLIKGSAAKLDCIVTSTDPSKESYLPSSAAVVTLTLRNNVICVSHHNPSSYQ